jgi:hypothetical protein
MIDRRSQGSDRSLKKSQEIQKDWTLIIKDSSVLQKSLVVCTDLVSQLIMFKWMNWLCYMVIIVTWLWWNSLSTEVLPLLVNLSHRKVMQCRSQYHQECIQYHATQSNQDSLPYIFTSTMYSIQYNNFIPILYTMQSMVQYWKVFNTIPHHLTGIAFHTLSVYQNVDVLHTAPPCWT